MYSPLSNSYEWSILNKDGQVVDKVNEAIRIGEEVSPAKMQVSYNKLKNRVKSPIMSKITEYIENGRIKMVYTPQELRIPLYLPFIVIVNPTTKLSTGLVFLSICETTKEDDGEYSCNEYKLKTSLESCYMALKFIEMKDSPKLIAPKHSIKLDPDTFNKVLFIIGKYFITTVMGCQQSEEIIDTYAMYNCTNPSLASIQRISDEFNKDDYANISTVLTRLASIPDLKNRLGKLTVSNFLESYINIYDAAMLLALENFSYFVYNVISVNNTTYVNNYHRLKQIVGKDGQDLYSALIVSICGA